MIHQRHHYTNTAIACEQCTKAPILIECHVTLHTNTANIHCPLCGIRVHNGQQTDVHHIQALHANLPYVAVKLGLKQAIELMTATTTQAHNDPSVDAYNASHTAHPERLKPHTYEAQTTPLYIKNGLPNPLSPDYDNRIAFERKMVNAMAEAASTNNHGVTYVNLKCHTCGAVSTVQANAASTATYCPFCGSQATSTLDQLNTEDTAWQVLSEHYNMHIVALQALYKEWTTNSLFAASHTFNAFLGSFATKAQAEINAKRTPQ